MGGRLEIQIAKTVFRKKFRPRKYSKDSFGDIHSTYHESFVLEKHENYFADFQFISYSKTVMES